ncbi:MAG: hypothetical protein RHS_4518 [Robinsoniella sp. RHS]|nr:MAG: hypothetical protein RHS_4518 [Robinsoniella sp. RHS]
MSYIDINQNVGKNTIKITIVSIYPILILICSCGNSEVFSSLF